MLRPVTWELRCFVCSPCPHPQAVSFFGFGVSFLILLSLASLSIFVLRNIPVEGCDARFLSVVLVIADALSSVQLCRQQVHLPESNVGPQSVGICYSNNRWDFFPSHFLAPVFCYLQFLLNLTTYFYITFTLENFAFNLKKKKYLFESPRHLGKRF